MTHPEWIAADWGATRLRLWAMRGAEMLDRRAVELDMGGLQPDGFAPALTRACEGWADAPVIACGMVGARGGWVEAPSATVPTKITPQLAQVAGRNVWLVGGLSQAAPPDLMHGEETRIAGLLAAQPGFDGVICLPGTHGKWAHISAEEVCSFQSVMTGELFALLRDHSALRDAMGEVLTGEAFDTALADAISQPHRAYGRLFQLRAGVLQRALSPDEASARLSATLIGWELAATRPYWMGQQVAIIGAPALSALYAHALRQQGVTTIETDAEAATLAGLHLGWKTVKDRI